MLRKRVNNGYFRPIPWARIVFSVGAAIATVLHAWKDEPSCLISLDTRDGYHLRVGTCQTPLQSSSTNIAPR